MGIARDTLGTGPAVLLVGGAAQFRAVDPDTAALAAALAARGCTAVHYDRPGRGDSPGAPPFTLAGEVDAIRALVAEVGGRATLFGSSSGGVIALAAAAEVPGIEALVLWEVPLGPEEGDEEVRFHARIAELVAAGEREEVVRHFMDGMPPEWFDGMRNGPDWPLYAHMAPTLQADAEAFAWSRSAPRAELWGGIAAPALVLVGEGAFPFMSDAADALVAALPHARRADVRGVGHRLVPEEVADVVAAHVRGIASGP